MKDYPHIIAVIMVSFMVVIILAFFNKGNYKQDSVVMGMTETIRSCAISNVDNSSRIETGELFLSKADFEEDFKKNILSNNNVKISKDSKIEFSYLENSNGSVKAIRVLIKDESTEYQATCKVNIVSS